MAHLLLSTASCRQTCELPTEPYTSGIQAFGHQIWCSSKLMASTSAKHWWNQKSTASSDLGSKSICLRCTGCSKPSPHSPASQVCGLVQSVGSILDAGQIWKAHTGHSHPMQEHAQSMKDSTSLKEGLLRQTFGALIRHPSNPRNMLKASPSTTIATNSPKRLDASCQALRSSCWFRLEASLVSK